MKIRDVLKLKNAGQANSWSVIGIAPTSSLRDATKVLAKKIKLVFLLFEIDSKNDRCSF
jgi:hypothetical protein